MAAEVDSAAVQDGYQIARQLGNRLAGELFDDSVVGEVDPVIKKSAGRLSRQRFDCQHP